MAGSPMAGGGGRVTLSAAVVTSYKPAAVFPSTTTTTTSNTSNSDASSSAAAAAASSSSVGEIRETERESPNSTAFSVQGDRCAFSYASGRIVLFDAINGTQLKEIHEKETGASHLCFAHHDLSILFADSEMKQSARNKIVSTFESTEEEDNDHPVRYLSLHDNQYLHLFYGHRSPVTSLSLFPTHSAFLSGSQDGHVLMFDLRQADARLRLRANSSDNNNSINELFAHVAAGPNGHVFAVAAGRDVSMYDARKYAAPFSVFQPAYNVNSHDSADVYATDVQFIGDGKMMITTSNGSISIVNDGSNNTGTSSSSSSSREGEVLRRINPKRQEPEQQENVVTRHMSHVARPSCSPDGAFIAHAAGHHVGVHASTFNGGAIAKQEGRSSSASATSSNAIAEDAGVYWSGHDNDVTALCWSPSSDLVVSGSSDAVAFWLPS